MNKLDFALDAVGQGFSVVPVSPNSKVPYIKWKAYQQERLGETALGEYWSSNPDYNIGIVTGSISGITVVDVDGQAGEDSLAKAGIHLPATYVVKTPHGWHYYYRYDPAIRNGVGVLEKVDIRSDRGLVLGVGSKIDSVQYLVHQDMPIATLNPVPELFKAYNQPEAQYPASSSNGGSVLERLGEEIADGERDQTLFDMALSLIRDKRFSDDECLQLLRMVNRYTVTPPLDDGVVMDKVRSASSYVTEGGLALPFVQGKDIVKKETEWLLQGRIPRAKLTVLTGFAGVGKSYVCMSLMASLSVGGELPDFSQSPRCRSTILLGEDGAEDTFKARMDAMGADATMYHALTMASLEENGILADLKRASFRESLRKHIEENDVGLLIIDPITSFMPRIDPRGEIQVREVLTPLNVMADSTGCAVIAVVHQNKDRKQTNQLHRISGSQAFGAVPRSVLWVHESPSDESLTVVETLKHNLSAKPVPLGFRITPLPNEPENGNGHTTTLEWEGELEDESSVKLMRSRLSPKKEVAKRFLRNLLSEGETDSQEVVQLAKEEGITEATLRKAREELGIGVDRIGNQEGGSGVVGSRWALPLTS